MASLNKLAIRGIRSFDDKKISVIEFYSPVTVIVGHNGSGKTTIIECLKYATTGDQPPNTRGGAFVHDPKMANEKEVKAQVKLRFWAANRTKMVAVRNLSVTVKKGGLTMKTLESILALAESNYEKGGKRGVISTKCAEMDAEIPHLLGVSKAVLENVIFCHQEDSYWPLAEASALKKKFDDIFEATRYTKALDSIKSLRKDRVAELKVDNERLQTLQNEKNHADKLKAKIDELEASVTTKEIEWEELDADIKKTTIENQRYNDRSTQFKEIYIKVDQLEARKTQLQEDLESASYSLQALDDTDEELQTKMTNFDNHMIAQRQKRSQKAAELQDDEENMEAVRKRHHTAVLEHGTLQGEANTHTQNLSNREEIIRLICTKHGIKGFEHTPLESKEVTDFVSRLVDLQRKQNMETEKVQSEGRAKTDGYQARLQSLVSEKSKFEQEKASARAEISKLSNLITSQRSRLESFNTLDTEIKYNTSDIQDKTARLEKTKSDLQEARYDAKVAEKVEQLKRLESQKEKLNTDMRALTHQADGRAKLSLKKSDLTKKVAEIGLILEGNSAKHLELTGTEAQVETMERDIDQAIQNKEYQAQELDNKATRANRDLHQIETSISRTKQQLKAKKEELSGLNESLRKGIEGSESLEAALKNAQEEVAAASGDTLGFEKAIQIYDGILKAGMAHKECKACARKLRDGDLPGFEAHLKATITKLKGGMEGLENADLEYWEGEVGRLQKLLPVQANRDALKAKEIPSLEQQIKEDENKVEEASALAEKMNDAVKEARNVLKELGRLKTHASNLSRTQQEIERLRGEITTLEDNLSSTGSSSTADEVQAELDQVSSKLKSIERERETLITEQKLHLTNQRTIQDELHDLQLKKSELKNKLGERDTVAKDVETKKEEVQTLQTRTKELDERIAASQQPIERLEREQRQFITDLDAKSKEAQHLSQEINSSADKLEQINRTVERYVRDRRDKKLKQTVQLEAELQEEINNLTQSIDEKRAVLAKFDKEINEGGATLSNIRDNLRLRRLKRDITAIQAEIDGYDMEETARTRRNFEKVFTQMENKLSDMKARHARLGGELSTQKGLLEGYHKDMDNDFKDIHKQYTEQLIKVKMSDMANNDLDKYGKALDNAIMKYHSLKMEEVNDTMRHLWNKTYQGTDIDGIKIRSDSEGGASKRSYNYRVVMTKDQVEMDMRGRCSAGQKMLASIIIRLALSDSFGQNCGILALDEPTNALDTENIEALAASLVDIINERRHHSSFQLIIITHDENFLRKLGEADVMEYYWRVSRDAKQKSVIERQRFG